jgi:hypothetical protein
LSQALLRILAEKLKKKNWQTCQDDKRRIPACGWQPIAGGAEQENGQPIRLAELFFFEARGCRLKAASPQLVVFLCN